jgi:hypothetical protein
MFIKSVNTQDISFFKTLKKTYFFKLSLKSKI